MKKILIVIIILALAIWAFASRGDSEDTTGMEDGHTHAPVTVDGTLVADTTASVLTWTGSKVLVDGYKDSGTIALKEGTFTFKDGMLTDGSFVIDMDTIKTVDTFTGNGHANLDKHLRSDDFFSVETYPEATFVVTNVIEAEGFTRKPEMTEGDDMEASEAQEEVWDGVTYQVTGDLTVKENTHPVVFFLEVYQGENDTVVAEGTVSVDRSKYDVRFGSGSFFDDLGDGLIDDIFRLDIYVVGSKEAAMTDTDMEEGDEDATMTDDEMDETEE